MSIQTAPLVAQIYDLYDFAPNGLVWIHDPFILDTVPISHTLCGDFTFEATFMDSSINIISDPMKYDTATRDVLVLFRRF